MLANSLDALRIRRLLGRDTWRAPVSLGWDSWVFDRKDQSARAIVSSCSYDGADWVHASVSRPTWMPDYLDLKHLHQAVFEDGWAYQVFSPPGDHVNIHDFALHLFGRADGKPVLPDFTEGSGSI